MGWETRRGKRVYVRKVRTPDGKVSSVYVGSGEVGERAAREDEDRRAAKRAARVAPAENPDDSPSEPSDAQAGSPTPDSQSVELQPQPGRESAGVAPAPLSADEIVERGCAKWPPALRSQREEFLRRLIGRGLVLIACRTAGIGNKEALERGFQEQSLPKSLPEIASKPLSLS